MTTTTTTTTVEAAKRLGVAPQELYQLIAEQRLHAAKNERGRIVVDLAEARQALGLVDEPGQNALVELEEAAVDVEEATERRDRAVLAAYSSDPDTSLSRVARAARMSVEGVRRVISRQGGEMRPRGRRAKAS